MNIRKPQTFVEKLKELQRQYISIEYRLNKLIEEYTKEEQPSMHELITARTAAAILHWSPRNVIRIAKREHLNVIDRGNRKLYEKAEIEKVAVFRE